MEACFAKPEVVICRILGEKAKEEKRALMGLELGAGQADNNEGGKEKVREGKRKQRKWKRK